MTEPCSKHRSSWCDGYQRALTHYSQAHAFAEIEADEKQASTVTWAKNGNLGRFTNFVNLMDMAAIAVPSGVLRCQPICAASLGNSLSGQHGMMSHLSDKVPGMNGITFLVRGLPQGVFRSGFTHSSRIHSSGDFV